MKTCFCGSDQPFSRCCGPVIKGIASANSAEKLMRSRYSAYVVADADYLIATTHASKRLLLSKAEILHWAKANVWQRLEIISTSAFEVEFKAYFRGANSKPQVHHEKSTFVYENDKWYYLDAVFNDEIQN